MSSRLLLPHRKDVINKARGDILEIGLGTGTNLPLYEDSAGSLSAVDPNPGMKTYIDKKLERLKRRVRFVEAGAEKLPFADDSFDTVVSTLTLCSIPRPEVALQEIKRVLRPQGRFVFLEHGRAPDRKVAVWQNRLEGLNEKLADGCHINRNMDLLIQNAGLRIANIDKFYLSGVPKTHGYLYKGWAEKAPADS